MKNEIKVPVMRKYQIRFGCGEAEIMSDIKARKQFGKNKWKRMKGNYLPGIRVHLMPEQCIYKDISGRCEADALPGDSYCEYHCEEADL